MSPSSSLAAGDAGSNRFQHALLRLAGTLPGLAPPDQNEARNRPPLARQAPPSAPSEPPPSGKGEEPHKPRPDRDPKKWHQRVADRAAQFVRSTRKASLKTLADLADAHADKLYAETQPTRAKADRHRELAETLRKKAEGKPLNPVAIVRKAALIEGRRYELREYHTLTDDEKTRLGKRTREQITEDRENTGIPILAKQRAAKKQRNIILTTAAGLGVATTAALFTSPDDPVEIVTPQSHTTSFDPTKPHEPPPKVEAPAATLAPAVRNEVKTPLDEALEKPVAKQKAVAPDYAELVVDKKNPRVLTIKIGASKLRDYLDPRGFNALSSNLFYANGKLANAPERESNAESDIKIPYKDDPFFNRPTLTPPIGATMITHGDLCDYDRVQIELLPDNTFIGDLFGGKVIVSYDKKSVNALTAKAVLGTMAMLMSVAEEFYENLKRSVNDGPCDGAEIRELLVNNLLNSGILYARKEMSTLPDDYNAGGGKYEIPQTAETRRNARALTSQLDSCFDGMDLLVNNALARYEEQFEAGLNARVKIDPTLRYPATDAPPAVDIALGVFREIIKRTAALHDMSVNILKLPEAPEQSVNKR